MIHCFTVNEQPMVLDVAGGALHAVDDTAYRLCRLLQDDLAAPLRLHSTDFEKEARAALADVPVSVVDDVLAELRTLATAGLLFTADNAKETLAALHKREPVVKALCLHIAHACNLACAYCFAGQGRYGEVQQYMSLETGKKAIDFLIAHAGQRRNLEIDFFGGEPTLNFDTVKGIVAYGRSREAETGKRFRFTLTTNGTLLDDEMNRYINAHMDNVVLSLDGRPAVHDRMRARHMENAQDNYTGDSCAGDNYTGRSTGSMGSIGSIGSIGSYTTLLPKLLALAKSRHHRPYYVRGTYTRHNLDFAADVLHLADAGFKHISVEPVVAPMSADYALRPEDVPTLCDEYEKLAAAMVTRAKAGRPFHFFHFNIDVEGGPCLAKRVTGCGAGTEYLAVTPDGSLYPCHQFVGETGFKVGNLDTGIVFTEICERFARCNVFDKTECARCWARYYCSGGCAANAFHQRGDLLLTDEVGCALMRKRVECALYLYAERNNLL